jgi:hypothetical protein
MAKTVKPSQSKAESVTLYVTKGRQTRPYCTCVNTSQAIKAAQDAAQREHIEAVLQFRVE